VPETWQGYDVIVFVGDILDRSSRGPEQGRELLEELDALDLETIIIPGNHDFNYYPDLADGLSLVRCIHQSAITVNGWMFYGLGSDRFDDGSEVRYPDIPELSDADSHPEQLDRQLANIVEGRSEIIDIVDTKHAAEKIRRSLHLYRDRYETLEELASNQYSENTVLLTHLPPFGTGIDQLSAHNPRYPDRMLGSIAVRSHIRQFSPSFNFCGHIHESEGVIDLNRCVCLNAGKGSTYSVKLGQKHPDAVRHENKCITK
jgi:Icc-related predicted phosphoesterase